MDNPTKWNITNSAQNIVSALVNPSKQHDHVFRREWSNTFAGFPKHKSSNQSQFDTDIKIKLKEYIDKLEVRNYNKAHASKHERKSTEQSPSTSIGDTNVPEIFMQEDFDLSNRDTFNTVITVECLPNRHTASDDNKEYFRTHYVPQEAQLITRSQIRRLQQGLTDHLDVIEEKLSSQISSRSGDFFQVMSSVDSVMDELSRAIKSVTSLRKKCIKLNETMMKPNMKSIQINKTRNNAQSVLDKLNDIAYLCKVQPMIQILLSSSDFVGALDLIAKSRTMLHKDLTRVVSLRYMESQLNEIERMIGTMMQQEFLTLISSEWDGSSGQQSSAAIRLSKLFDYFANGYSEIPDRGSLTLLSLLQIQAEKFVNQFHEERKKRVESALDIEQWRVVEVPGDFQKLISMIIDDKLKIGEIFTGENLQELAHSSDLSRNTSLTSLPQEIAQAAPQNGSSKQQMNNIDRFAIKDYLDLAPKRVSAPQDKSNQRNQVEVAGCAFVIVNSVITLIRTVMDFCKCAQDIRSLSADLLERLFKILELYNSKTYHLVYSAGAIRVAGLKTITTRSLILSQRSLKLITLFIPAIYKHFSQLLPDDNRLRRFGEIKALYDEHVEKIPERIKSMVRDVIDLQLQEWEAKPPVPSAQFNSVTQHLIRLHDNIQDISPPDEMKALLRRVHDTFIEVLIIHLRRLNISNDAGPQHWLVMQELTFYRISLSKLSVFNELELNFEDLWLNLSAEISSGTDEKLCAKTK